MPHEQRAEDKAQPAIQTEEELQQAQAEEELQQAGAQAEEQQEQQL